MHGRQQPRKRSPARPLDFALWGAVAAGLSACIIGFWWAGAALLGVSVALEWRITKGMR